MEHILNNNSSISYFVEMAVNASNTLLNMVGHSSNVYLYHQEHTDQVSVEIYNDHFETLNVAMYRSKVDKEIVYRVDTWKTILKGHSIYRTEEEVEMDRATVSISEYQYKELLNDEEGFKNRDVGIFLEVFNSFRDLPITNEEPVRNGLLFKEYIRDVVSKYQVLKILNHYYLTLVTNELAKERQLEPSVYISPTHSGVLLRPIDPNRGIELFINVVKGNIEISDRKMVISAKVKDILDTNLVSHVHANGQRLLKDIVEQYNTLGVDIVEYLNNYQKGVYVC